tara:strand:- start:307 stop:792 length:486 start_codon:yes stop_codon:yes gene_type:complete
MSFNLNIYKDTYLNLLPFEIQDYINEIIIKEYKENFHKELLENLNPGLTLKHIHDNTLYKKLIDYILTIEWNKLHLFMTQWIENVVYKKSNRHIYNYQWINNPEHDVCRYVISIENIFLLLHNNTLKNSEEHNIRTAIMLSVLPLSYQELLSLCNYIKNNI